MRPQLLLVCALSGCVAPGGAVVPWPGVWDYADGGIVEDGCGADDLYTDPDATFVLEEPSTSGFTIREQVAFPCTLEGRDFDCPERRREEAALGDTTLSWSVAVEGRFTAPRRMTGEQTFTVACVGGLCDLDRLLLGVDLPCAWVVAFDATAR